MSVHRRFPVADSKGRKLEVIETCEKVPRRTLLNPKGFDLGKPSYRLSTGERLTALDD